MQYGPLTGSDAPDPSLRQPDWTPITTRSDASALLQASAPTRRVPGPTIASTVLSFPQGPASLAAPLDLPRAGIVRVSAPRDDAIAPPGDDEINLNGFGLTCENAVRAQAAPGGMIDVEVESPCSPESEVVLDHAGLIFLDRTDTTGLLVLKIPAMEAETTVAATIGGGDRISVPVSVPEAEAYDRVAVLWDGDTELSVHALEFDAGPGSSGHVSAKRPGVPVSGSGEPAQGGFLTRLGNPDLARPRLAEVYSLPTGLIGRAGTVRLSVSARVSPDNCGETVRVTRIRSSAGYETEHARVPVAFPGCEAVGSILVLKNLLEDLKIAQN